MNTIMKCTVIAEHTGSVCKKDQLKSSSGMAMFNVANHLLKRWGGGGGGSRTTLLPVSKIVLQIISTSTCN